MTAHLLVLGSQLRNPIRDVRRIGAVDLLLDALEILATSRREVIPRLVHGSDGKW
jgi:hypothetical protein